MSARPDPALRVGFVPGVEPDRFARRWSEGPRPARLELVPVPAARAREALAAGELDMCFLRLSAADGMTAEDPALHTDLHTVPLWEEQAVVVVGAENTLSLHDELTAAELAEETEILADRPDDEAERVAVVATGVGYTRMPMSLARFHHRRDAVHRPAPDREPTRIALVWPREADDEARQEFVAAVRGRTARSGRGAGEAKDAVRAADGKQGSGKRTGARSPRAARPSQPARRRRGGGR